jgi:hypothetical protein
MRYMYSIFCSGRIDVKLKEGKRVLGKGEKWESS